MTWVYDVADVDMLNGVLIDAVQSILVKFWIYPNFTQEAQGTRNIGIFTRNFRSFLARGSNPQIALFYYNHVQGSKSK